MNRLIIGSFVLGLSTSAVNVAAQERVPYAGSAAVGVDAGVFAPSNDQLENAWLLNVLYEYYVTPRVSVRTDFGWANPGFQREPVDSLRQVPLRVDVNYNWERGRWHPFVGAGVGAYFVQLKDNGQAFGDRETKLGVNTEAGVEYFLQRRMALKGEGRYHAISRVNNGLDPSGLAMTIGLKTYF